MIKFNPVFLLLCGVGLCSFISYNLIRMPALAPFAESLGAGPVVVGFIVAASTLTGIFLKLPMGALSDVMNRRRLMLVGVLAFALPPFAYPLVTDLEMLAGLRLIHGLATAEFTPLGLASVASMFPLNRGAVLGWYTSSAQAGMLLGPMLGGWLVDTAGFSQTFLVGGGVGLLALGLFVTILFLHPEETPLPQANTEEILNNLRQSLKTVIGHSQMLATSMAEAAKMMANGLLMAFLPLYGLSIGLSLAESGLLFGIQGFISFLSKPVMGQVSDKFGRRPLITLGLTICGMMIMGIPHVTQFLSLLFLAACFGFGEAVITSSSAALIADLAAPENVGAGMGLRGTIMDIGHASGPILAGVLVATISYTGAFTLIGALQFLAAWGFWIITCRQTAMKPM